MTARAILFEAARLFAHERLIEGGACVVERGRVRAVLESRAAVRQESGPGLERVDLGDVLLVPAFVDAHAHLELSGLAGEVSAQGTFTDWIRALLAARGRYSAGDLARAARSGAQRLLATGTSLVGDIDSSGAIESGARGLALRVLRFREALDAGDATRAPAVIERLRRPAVRRRRFHEGLSPHAPYTVSRELGSELGRLARIQRARVAIHFAETSEESDWLERGAGPLSAILAHAPHTTGLGAIERAGLLGARTLLVHGNCVSADERLRIHASGAALVHCPGTHLFFGRAPFDARAWLDAGVPLALGTDSLASNADLDMGRELALFTAAQPGLSPREAFACATRNGARALGFAGRAGEIAPGALADFALYELGPGSGRDALAALAHGEARFRGLWMDGSAVTPTGRRLIQKAPPRSESKGRVPE